MNEGVGAIAPQSGQKTMPAPHHSIFTGQTLFLTVHQQCQINKGKVSPLLHHPKNKMQYRSLMY